MRNTPTESNALSERRLSLRSGTVTALRRQARRKGRVSVFVDGEFALGISEEVLAGSTLHKGLAVSEDLLLELLNRDIEFTARARAIKFLSYRARSEKEIGDRLRRYGYEQAVVDKVLAWLSTRGYVDDQAFASTFAAERAGNRGFGARRIAAELSRLGISRELADEALVSISDESPSENETVLRKARQRWQRLRSEPDPRKRKSKLVQYLQRRGFDYSDAMAILDRISAADDRSDLT